MAKSFADSLNAINTESSSTMSLRSASVMVASEDTITWTLDTNYKYTDNYEEGKRYEDSDYSYVDDKKNVTINQNQTNLTQEDNSQYIPFEMFRFYDGIDLTNMTLSVYFLNMTDAEGTSAPINVRYSDTKIRFGFLVPKEATAISGKLRLEIHAKGKNPFGGDYLLKTKPNDDIEILESLQGNGNIIVDETWSNTVLEDVQNAAIEAQSSAIEAKNAAEQAQEVLKEVDTKINDAATAIADEIKSEMADTYYTIDETNNAITNVVQPLSEAMQSVSDDLDAHISESNTKVSEIENNVTDIQTELDNYYKKEETYSQAEIDDKISDIDVTSQLNSLESKIAENYYNKEEIEQKISDVDVSGQLADYYPKTQADEKFADKSVESSVLTNTNNISSISTVIAEMQEQMNTFNTDPTLTYDVSYEAETGLFKLYEMGKDEEPSDENVKKQFTIVGGSGGTTSSTTITINRITVSPYVMTKDTESVIEYEYFSVDSSGDDTGEGTAVWKVGNTVVATSTAEQGKNSFNIKDYISVGTQKVTLTITDSAGAVATKYWTVQVVDLYLESTFNDKYTYPIADLSFSYTPYGAVEKTIYFKLDGYQIGTTTTSSSGIPMSYTIPAQEHGSHLLEVYAAAVLNGTTIETNHIYKDILFYDETSSIPVIGCSDTKLTTMQYDSTNITYTVYNPKTETPKVILAVDDEIVSTLTLENPTNVWSYKTGEVGEHVLTITCGETVKTINLIIEKLDITVEPVTANLAFDFNPSGKSNNDEDRLWTNGTTSMTVSDNFDWINGGYQLDNNGDQYFCVKAGTSAVIDYKLFADDPRKNGKAFKLVYKTTNVAKSDATFLTCQQGTTTPIGLEMNVHNAYVKSSAESLFLPYSEEDIIEFEFVIRPYDFNDSSNNASNAIPCVMSYEDGRPYRPMLYASDYSFTQSSPVDITVGSEDCDVHIYRMKAYSASLTNRNVLSNFVADARNANEMINRYKRNQIFDENNNITPDSVANACPDLKVIKLEVPYFTNDKNNFVKANFECIHTGGDPILDNWKVINGYHSGQGTTSNEYGEAGRNMDLLFCFDGLYQNKKITFEEDYITTLTMGDGTTIYDDGTGKITLTRNSVPTNYLNIKVNIASSDNANNALLQKRYNDFLPYLTPAMKKDSKVKNSMEFVNCVVFLKETDPDVTTHREFNDNEWHFYAIGNIGDSKKTDYTRVSDSDDHKEFVVEIMDNTYPNATFPGDETSLELLETVSFDDENDQYTYEFRYEHSDITDEERAENIQTWINFYKFVVNSTDDEFVDHLGDWFIVDSALYFYLFTERFTMTDNRAKNTFWHWFKYYISTEEATILGDEATYYVIDDKQAAINNGYRFEFWDYDNDTALGINNSGELTMPYGKEDIDYRTDGDPSSGYIFNAAESTFFMRIRNLMYNELAELYRRLESTNCWSANSTIKEFNEWQQQFPEMLQIIDHERKYERTWLNGTPRFLKSMANGFKIYHRAQFERDQDPYIATKYFGTYITENQIMFRCNTPVEAVVTPDYTLHLIPYVDMYICGMFGATNRFSVRAKAGQEYAIECPFTKMDDTAVLIYNASAIQSVGDLSACYIHDNDFSKATKLKILIMSNDTEGYVNTFLTNVNVGNIPLLEYLDIRKTPNLVQSINLSGCNNLEEFYATDSGITGVIFADGGKLRIAHLPEISSLTVKDLMYLENFQIAGFDNIQTLVIENTPKIDSYLYANSSPNLTNVRLIGIDWGSDDGITDTSILNRLLGIAGVDNSGYLSDLSVLSGTYYTPVIKEKELADYNAAWSDLTITYDSMINQFTVTSVNDDGTVLDIQYVNIGEMPEDPLTRENNPISTPTKASTVENDFTFAGWDRAFTAVFENQTYTATYTATLREYTVQYVSKNATLQTTIAPYGSMVEYTGTTPIYVTEESAYKYYLFDRWDKSGYVNGNKIINAIFDSCQYSSGYFDGKEFNDLRPVEKYALIKLGMESSVVEIMDDFVFKMGNDYDFDDVESTTFIEDIVEFTGSNYIDTGVPIIDIDRSFVFAIDYEFGSNNSSGATLMQCFKSISSDGFKLLYNGYPRIQWGTSSQQCATGSNREMLVLRHIAGETKVYVYMSNLSDSAIGYFELERNRTMTADSTLVFGCVKADDGTYESYATGSVYWAKIWYADLGDDICRKISAYTREQISTQMCGFKRKYLSDNSGNRSAMSFLATHVLRTTKPMGTSSSSNAGGWGVSPAKEWLNNRFYNGLPLWMKQLIKQVKVNYSVGSSSTEVDTCDCYVYLPAIIELSADVTSEPYYSEETASSKTIEYMVDSDDRIRANHLGNAVAYSTRSTNASGDRYFYYVATNGAPNGFGTATTEYGLVIELSM